MIGKSASGPTFYDSWSALIVAQPDLLLLLQQLRPKSLMSQVKHNVRENTSPRVLA
jgi:hypothetical protein